ncbi:hypothetical protein C5167_022528 [Papaver somniferum]|uniref:Homeobox-leucine zipper protein n=1 Tax=Papaver somniferum TaxID=3469 RepID=A0A4Y7JL87_PAPSO|nr:homeobox-leucine zipper protein ATHB-13-like [Papaver somniferum]RZC60782.1 hypothetical protein C5167_022528 [Papaver somniferum]
MDFFPANFMLHQQQQQQQNNEEDHHQHHSINPMLNSCNPQDFHGVASLLGKRSMSFSGVELMREELNGDEELSDDGSQAGERKRRLNMEQVRTLEKNFELGNKLEPERKLQLARALNLQPRQIAIWFQNRRARWKTKQLEKDYDVLKRQFEAVKADNESLQAQNKKLHAEILALKSREQPTELINLNKETEGSSSNRSDNSSDLNLDISRTSAIDSPNPTSRPFFPTSVRPTTMVQLLQSSSVKSEYQCPSRIVEHHQTVQDEGFSNMFCSIDDQPAFWPWAAPEHQQFH